MRVLRCMRERLAKPGRVSGFSFCAMVVVAVDTYDFIIMCGTIAAAVWADTRGVRDMPGGHADTPAPSPEGRGGA